MTIPAPKDPPGSDPAHPFNPPPPGATTPAPPPPPPAIPSQKETSQHPPLYYDTALSDDCENIALPIVVDGKTVFKYEDIQHANNQSPPKQKTSTTV